MPWHMRDLTPNELTLITEVVEEEAAAMEKQRREAQRQARGRRGR